MGKSGGWLLPEARAQAAVPGANRDADYAVPELLIEALDDDGYLTISVEEAAIQLSVEPKLVEITLQVLQSMPPCGLGARNLLEYLRLQLATCAPAEVPYGTEAVIDNLTRRYRTMHKVMQAIVQHQDDFLMHGPAHLQPLSKKQIAIALDFHEATVCRATKNKYVLLRDGQLVPIDIFFDDALPAKNMLWRLVNSEDKSSPLSDRMLQHELAGHGFDLAHRTVTKYRVQLDIPPAGQRKAA
ncbi:MAG: hypothetical protein GX358_06880 [candidate division WS1 bacterium]|nr:hypothetical protein [candidate division WS1 bacterium]